MLFRITFLLLTTCHLSVSTIPLITYKNAQFTAGASYQLNGQLFVGSKTECACQCFANEGCLTATYVGMNQSCILFSAKIEQGKLQPAPAIMNSSVINFVNRTIPVNSNLPATIQWSFDGNLNDSFGIYNGMSANGTVQWVSPGYRGDGMAAYFANRSYSVVSHSLQLIGTSFTISTWIMLLSNAPLSSSEFGVFTHCGSMTINKCLYLTVRYDKLLFSLYINNSTGNSSLMSNIWCHVAYVYDVVALTQSVYLNGRLDGILSPTGILQSNASQIWIGASPYTYMYSNPFAYMDEMIFVSRVKSTSELLDEATLVAYYTFDNSFLDSSPNKITNNSGTGVQFDANGRVNQALLLNSSNSFFQITSFYFLGQSNYSYTFSLWIQPFATNGTIIQLLSVNNDWWSPMLGFDSSNHLMTQTWSGSVFYNVALNSSVLPLNIWTHVAATFSTINGLRLFVNGTWVNTTSSSYSHAASGAFNIMTIGTCTPIMWCSNAETRIVPNQYTGKIDEMRVYSRELTSVEVNALANI